MRRCLIFGSGFVGKRLNERLKDSKLAIEKVRDSEEVEREIVYAEPDFIVNVIGKTNLDWCEKNKEEAYFSNVEVPLILAKLAEKHGLPMFHLSTGGFYNGSRNGLGFTEQDEPFFIPNYYTETKLLAERELEKITGVPIMQLRIHMPIDNKPFYDCAGRSRDLLSKLLTYASNGIVEDVQSVSSIDLLADSIRHLSKGINPGKYHVVFRGPISLPEILGIYQSVAGEKTEIKIIPKIEIAGRVPRACPIIWPMALLDRGMKIPSVFDGISECVREYVKNTAQ